MTPFAEPLNYHETPELQGGARVASFHQGIKKPRMTGAFASLNDTPHKNERGSLEAAR
ncbi:hypothetical protein MRCP2_p2910 (plasmid) [Aquipseudomonas alcaligenes]|nr:hypothetical protein MRCP2_p2910 [Pseudomonas alcaligenes]